MLNNDVEVSLLILNHEKCCLSSNHASCPFPVDASCIWPQIRPWSSLRLMYCAEISFFCVILVCTRRISFTQTLNISATIFSN